LVSLAPAVPGPTPFVVSLSNHVAPPHDAPDGGRPQPFVVSLSNHVAPPHDAPDGGRPQPFVVSLSNHVAPPHDAPDGGRPAEDSGGRARTNQTAPATPKASHTPLPLGNLGTDATPAARRRRSKAGQPLPPSLRFVCSPPQEPAKSLISGFGGRVGHIETTVTGPRA
jgi:hypothetical protein